MAVRKVRYPCSRRAVRPLGFHLEATVAPQLTALNDIRTRLSVWKGKVKVLELSLGIGHPNEPGEEHPDCFLIDATLPEV